MTNTQIQTVRRAISLLSALIDEPKPCAAVPFQSPIRRFVQEFIAPDPKTDLSCAEAWQYFQEVAQAGELQSMRKSIFLRQLPTIMEAAYQVRRSHSIVRSGRRVRGFRGVGIKMDSAIHPVKLARSCSSGGGL